MMKRQVRWIGALMMLLCALALSLSTAFGQSQRDPLGQLKRAITQANAPILISTQESAITALITAYKDAQPDEPDATIEAARDAYVAAILAGKLADAQAQATIIANQSAVLAKNRLDAQAKFDIDVLTILFNGGQLDPLNTKFGAERVLGLVSSLAGPGGGFDGGGPGGGGHPGGGRP
ncbi:MAG: hypothetical protein JST85_19650 [Acidobacteria bacterium]|nr:hypothetical protein [Acidobacteriota bacterium]